MNSVRTDMADELRRQHTGELPGVVCREERLEGLSVFALEILDEAGERRFCSLGKGRVDLAACYEAAKALEIPYIMYEQDCDWVNGDAFEATAESWAFMKELEEA